MKIKDKVQKEIEMQLDMIAAKVDEINELAMDYTKDQREENIDHFINHVVVFLRIKPVRPQVFPHKPLNCWRFFYAFIFSDRVEMMFMSVDHQ